MNINTGKGSITLSNLIAIYSISMVTSLSGLAVAPILGDLESVFKNASQLQIQLLVSIPSMVIIPFVLLSGKLSLSKSKKTILLAGLGIFVASSILFLFSDSIDSLLAISVLLGVGAGMVIPLSTGYVADYFAGERRTRQLGIASAIANLSLVLATFLAGFLADINWHYSFMVYLLSVVALGLAFTLPKEVPASDRVHAPGKAPKTAAKAAAPTKPAPAQAQPAAAATAAGRVRYKLPVNLMLIYYFVTVVALAIPQNISIYMQKLGIGSSDLSGTLVSLFFLAIMVPGFTIAPLMKWLRSYISPAAFLSVLLGYVLFLITRNVWLLSLGVVFVGLGYGVIQPLVYDRTSSRVPPPRATYALSFVMAMNYVAILSYPFILNSLEKLFHSASVYFPFVLSLILTFIFLIYSYFKRV